MPRKLLELTAIQDPSTRNFEKVLGGLVESIGLNSSEGLGKTIVESLKRFSGGDQDEALGALINEIKTKGAEAIIPNLPEVKVLFAELSTIQKEVNENLKRFAEGLTRVNQGRARLRNLQEGVTQRSLRIRQLGARFSGRTLDPSAARSSFSTSLTRLSGLNTAGLPRLGTSGDVEDIGRQLREATANIVEITARGIRSDDDARELSDAQNRAQALSDALKLLANDTRIYDAALKRLDEETRKATAIQNSFGNLGQKLSFATNKELNEFNRGLSGAIALFQDPRAGFDALRAGGDVGAQLGKDILNSLGSLGDIPLKSLTDLIRDRVRGREADFGITPNDLANLTVTGANLAKFITAFNFDALRAGGDVGAQLGKDILNSLGSLGDIPLKSLTDLIRDRVRGREADFGITPNDLANLTVTGANLAKFITAFNFDDQFRNRTGAPRALADEIRKGSFRSALGLSGKNNTILGLQRQATEALQVAANAQKELVKIQREQISKLVENLDGNFNTFNIRIGEILNEIKKLIRPVERGVDPVGPPAPGQARGGRTEVEVKGIPERIDGQIDLTGTIPIIIDGLPGGVIDFDQRLDNRIRHGVQEALQEAIPDAVAGDVQPLFRGPLVGGANGQEVF